MCNLTSLSATLVHEQDRTQQQKGVRTNIAAANRMSRESHHQAHICIFFSRLQYAPPACTHLQRRLQVAVGAIAAKDGRQLRLHAAAVQLALLLQHLLQQAGDAQRLVHKCAVRPRLGQVALGPAVARAARAGEQHTSRRSTDVGT